MFRGLRWQFTLIYTLAALAVVVLVGAGSYLIVARYFAGVTDLALQHKMAHEFHALAAPLPPSLLHADRDWSLVRQDAGLLPPTRSEPSTAHRNGNTPSSNSTDIAELAAIIVLPLDTKGRILFHPNTTAPLLTPHQGALAVALQQGYDLRTIMTDDGQRVRLLTYRLTRSDGPAALQLARELGDQERILNQLTAGLLMLAFLSMALVGTTSWWLAERALRPAEKAWERQQRFIASASHELRTPLTLIRASSEVALRSLDQQQHDQRELLGDIVAESDHMRRLVDDLLILSRLDSGQLSLIVEAVELSVLLQDLQRQTAHLATERGIQVQLDAVTGYVQADAARLRQVLLILLDNALRHTPPRGTICLAAIAEGRNLRISVSDTGNGIAPEHLPHLFERFYRVDPARGREGGNAGLGLAIAKSLITAMGGQIGLTSTSQQGTTAWVVLPQSPTNYR
ncbi:sensor histidine kinase [Candidatus Viridilinea mediisalina]|uniref:histidine kinase n=1 Tax=Candidatus Viridilinea mediisalina TaxID=2024553 RepID=A0A2A6RG07_9CHLR|nr:ATP-binding protein [Candidatus Viridilinea mediisalina]PDW02007.1 histidine kinase [Candidatus Viridilinea mediisalina]